MNSNSLFVKNLFIFPGKDYSKYVSEWDEMFKKHKLNETYRCFANFDHYCYLKNHGVDAEQVLIRKIKKIESNG